MSGPTTPNRVFFSSFCHQTLLEEEKSLSRNESRGLSPRVGTHDLSRERSGEKSSATADPEPLIRNPSRGGSGIRDTSLEAALPKEKGRDPARVSTLPYKAQRNLRGFSRFSPRFRLESRRAEKVRTLEGVLKSRVTSKECIRTPRWPSARRRLDRDDEKSNENLLKVADANSPP